MPLKLFLGQQNTLFKQNQSIIISSLNGPFHKIPFVNPQGTIEKIAQKCLVMKAAIFRHTNRMYSRFAQRSLS